MNSFCKAKWQCLMKRSKISDSLSTKWELEVSNYYGESRRHYHTMEHIEELLNLSSKFSSYLINEVNVEFSIWFHDVIYDPKSSENEEQSADLWRKFATEANLTEDQQNLVFKYILLTKTHKVDPLEQDRDLMFFLDMDMCILGREEERFDLYTRQIRKEYCHVEDSVFFLRRPDFLEKLVGGGVYLTKEFQEIYEEKAKQNVAREIMALRNHQFL
jgi:predicted metal-dependent HD superfamily phosphohydrolase